MIDHRMQTFADVVELADTPDLGSGANAWRFESFRPHHIDRLKSIALTARADQAFFLFAKRTQREFTMWCNVLNGPMWSQNQYPAEVPAVKWITPWFFIRNLDLDTQMSEVSWRERAWDMRSFIQILEFDVKIPEVSSCEGLWAMWPLGHIDR